MCSSEHASFLSFLILGILRNPQSQGVLRVLEPSRLAPGMAGSPAVLGGGMTPFWAVSFFLGKMRRLGRSPTFLEPSDGFSSFGSGREDEKEGCPLCPSRLSGVG